MHETTELQEVPGSVGVLPPPPPARPVASTATPPNQINQTPMLPHVAAPVPRPATAASNPFASSMDYQWAPAPQKPRKNHSGAARRAFSWLIVLGVVAGLAYAGITYGSDLMDLAQGEDRIDEPSIAAVFPTVDATAAPVRTATFIVERPDALNGPQKYEVTTDFDTGISRVVIDRVDSPDLEVLTLFDGAVIRRVDQPVWYRLDRGTFPAGSEMGRTRWIRTIDELLPPALRQGATIDRATESAIGTESTKRLLVTLDPTVVGQIATAAPGVPAEGRPAVPAGLPNGLTFSPGDTDIGTLEVEVWVDADGLVRKSIMPSELGGETITVTSVTPDPWQPVFPTEDMISPLTAAALFGLSI